MASRRVRPATRASQRESKVAGEANRANLAQGDETEQAQRERSYWEAHRGIKAMHAKLAKADETKQTVLLARRLLEAKESPGQAGRPVNHQLRPVSPNRLALFKRVKAEEARDAAYNARVEARFLALDLSEDAAELARALENNSAAPPNAPENDGGQTLEALAASLQASVAAIVEFLVRHNV